MPPSLLRFGGSNPITHADKTITLLTELPQSVFSRQCFDHIKNSVPTLQFGIVPTIPVVSEQSHCVSQWAINACTLSLDQACSSNSLFLLPNLSIFECLTQAPKLDGSSFVHFNIAPVPWLKLLWSWEVVTNVCFSLQQLTLWELFIVFLKKHL